MTETIQNPAQANWNGVVAHTELGSTDPEATTKFLTNVFGMNFEANPGPMDSTYYMSYTEGMPSCGVRPTMPQEPGASQTPYVNVDNIEATTNTVTQNGGTVVLPKTPVPNMGWMAWYQIPGGNTIAVWQDDKNAA